MYKKACAVFVLGLLIIVSLLMMHKRGVEKINAALVSAVEQDNLKATQDLIERGANPNAQRYIGTPRNATQMAIRAFFAGQERNITGISVLQIAVENDDLEIARILLKNGANPNIRDAMDRTLLMRATILGRADIVDLLLQHGAEVNARGTNDWTALSTVEAAQEWGTNSSYNEVRKILLRYGAKP